MIELLGLLMLFALIFIATCVAIPSLLLLAETLWHSLTHQGRLGHLPVG